MKLIEFEQGGTVFHLCLNAAALFDIYDRFGSDQPVLSHLQDGGKQGFEATCWMLWKLAEQGELVRRWQGHRPEPIPRESQLRTLLTPHQAVAAKAAIRSAVAKGFEREAPTQNPQGIDLGLARLKAQTGEGRTLSEYLQTATQVLRLDVGDALRLTPGQLNDLVELEIRRGRLKRAE